MRTIQKAKQNGVWVQLFNHVKKTHNDIVSSSSLTARQHTSDLNLDQFIGEILTLSGKSLLRDCPFSLSTFKNSCGIPSAPAASSVGKSLVNSSLICSVDFSNKILVEVTSAIDDGVPGMKLRRSFCSVENFLYGYETEQCLPIVVCHT